MLREGNAIFFVAVTVFKYPPVFYLPIQNRGGLAVFFLGQLEGPRSGVGPQNT